MAGPGFVLPQPCVEDHHLLWQRDVTVHDLAAMQVIRYPVMPLQESVPTSRVHGLDVPNEDRSRRLAFHSCGPGSLAISRVRLVGHEHGFPQDGRWRKGLEAGSRLASLALNWDGAVIPWMEHPQVEEHLQPGGFSGKAIELGRKVFEHPHRGRSDQGALLPQRATWRSACPGP